MPRPKNHKNLPKPDDFHIKELEARGYVVSKKSDETVSNTDTSETVSKGRIRDFKAEYKARKEKHTVLPQKDDLQITVPKPKEKFWRCGNPECRYISYDGKFEYCPKCGQVNLWE